MPFFRVNIVVKKQQQDNKDDAITHREVYIFYHNLSKPEKKGDFDEFFAKLDDVKETFENGIIFLETDSVWQYSRFMDTNHAVIKAYVPEHAIEGRSYGLTLKKGFLAKEKIHGCFPGWARGLIYVKNPFFDDLSKA